MSDTLLAGIVATIEPADEERAARVRELLADGLARDPDGLPDGLPDGPPDDTPDDLLELAARLAAATHTFDVQFARRYVVICAADHGVDSATGRPPPDRARATIAALDQVISGTAAVCAIARSASASVMVVDCGIAAHESRPPGILDLPIGAGTADICQGPAMTREQAEAALRTGIAFLLSLANDGCDCLALGQIAPGSHGVATAMIAQLADVPPSSLTPAERDIATRARAANPLTDADPIDVLAALGGYDIGVMCGIILAAASLRIPVILDDRGTSAAALLAARLAPASAGYLIASHVGTSEVHRQALGELGLSAVFDMAMAQGEGVGAATALPILATVANLLRANVELLRASDER